MHEKKLMNEPDNLKKLLSHTYKLKWKNIELQKKLSTLKKCFDGTDAERLIIIEELNKKKGCQYTVTCPICQKNECAIIGRSFLTDKNNYPIYSCISCEHKFLSYFPKDEEITSWYQGMEYSIRNRKASNISSYEINEEWNSYLDTRINAMNQYVIERLNLPKNLYIGEVGCLEGTLLKKLTDLGNRTVGFEINADIANKSQKLYSLEILNKNIETDDFSAYTELDCLLSFHTFEHLKDPANALTKCAKMIKSGGGILIEVPCDDDEMDNPEHFHFFNEKSLKQLLQKEFLSVQVHKNTYLRMGKYKLGSLYASGLKK